MVEVLESQRLVHLPQDRRRAKGPTVKHRPRLPGAKLSPCRKTRFAVVGWQQNDLALPQSHPVIQPRQGGRKLRGIAGGPFERG